MTDDAVQFRVVWEAWQEALADSASSTRATVSGWKAQLTELKSKQRALAHAGAWTAGPRDLLGVLGLSRRRRAHASVLGWLCDPSAPHPLGDRVCAALLELAGAPRTTLPRPLRVGYEGQAGSGLVVDLVIRAPGLTLVVLLDVEGLALQEPEAREALVDAFRNEQDVVWLCISPRTNLGHEAFRRCSWRELNASLKSLREAHTPCVTLSSYIETLDALFP